MLFLPSSPDKGSSAWNCRRRKPRPPDQVKNTLYLQVETGLGRWGGVPHTGSKGRGPRDAKFHLCPCNWGCRISLGRVQSLQLQPGASPCTPVCF